MRSQQARALAGTFNVTAKELELLGSIAKSEYQNTIPSDKDIVGHAIWLDYIADSMSRGGVLTSLQRKGLVGVQIVPISKSDNAQAGVSDSTVWLTESGWSVLNP